MRLKYGNKKTLIDNIKFDSKKESLRYSVLKLIERAGELKELELQKPFVLQIGFTDNMGRKHRPITYIADFYYYCKKRKSWVVEDVKGMRTEVYRLKKKLLLYAYRDFLFEEVV